jgi:histidine triad (HIT) family protein
MYENCIFCKIVRKEIPSNIVFEDDDLLAFYDINPQAPVHILIIPKKHIPSLAEVREEDQEILGKLLLGASKVAKKLAISEMVIAWLSIPIGMHNRRFFISTYM